MITLYRMPTIIHTINRIPWGDEGEQKSMDWVSQSEGGAVFYAKWCNLKKIWSYKELRAAHMEMFNVDISVWNQPQYVFTQMTLIHLHFEDYIKRDDAVQLYYRVNARLGEAIIGHEMVWEELGTNLGHLVLGAIIKESYPLLRERVTEMFQKDPHVTAVLGGTITVPLQMTVPVEGNDTFQFISDLSSL